MRYWNQIIEYQLNIQSQFKPVQSNRPVDSRGPKEKGVPQIFTVQLHRRGSITIQGHLSFLDWGTMEFAVKIVPSFNTVETSAKINVLMF